MQQQTQGLVARLSMTVDSGLPWMDVDGHAEACTMFGHIKVIELNYHHTTSLRCTQGCTGRE